MCFGEQSYRNARESLVSVVFRLLHFISKKSDNVDLMKYELQTLRGKSDKYSSQQQELEKLRLENTVRKC